MERSMFVPETRMAADDAALKAKREALKEKLKTGAPVSISPDGNVTKGPSGSTITIPKGKLADDAVTQAKREELKRKLLEGKKVTIDGTGKVTGPDSNSTVIIPPGKLANDDSSLKDARERIRRQIIKDKLVNKETIYVNSRGGAEINPNNQTSLKIPGGVLAVSQWYEKDPGLLMAEKAAMNHAFPHFTLDKLDDGRLAWVGSLNIGIIGNNQWHIMAVYNNNHPEQVMGSSVRVYLVEPDIDELIKDLGWRPLHLLMDSNRQLYLCTAEAGNIKTGKETTSAASVIAWAVKWLMAFELVLTGDLSQEDFNTHGVI